MSDVNGKSDANGRSDGNGKLSKDRSARSLLLTILGEAVAPTGLGDEVAIPHAVVPGLERPLLALGASAQGIDFNAPDDRPAKLIFLLLMPPRAHDQEVRILAQIARAAIEPASRAKLLEAPTIAEVFAHFSRTQQPLPGRSTRRVSLADI